MSWHQYPLAEEWEYSSCHELAHITQDTRHLHTVSHTHLKWLVAEHS